MVGGICSKVANSDEERVRTVNTKEYEGRHENKNGQKAQK